MYIARITEDEKMFSVFTPRSIPAIVVRSKKAVTCFKLPFYGSISIQVCSVIAYEVLTCKIPDLLYWESFENTLVNNFRSTVIFSVNDVRDTCALLWENHGSPKIGHDIIKILSCHNWVWKVDRHKTCNI